MRKGRATARFRLTAVALALAMALVGAAPETFAQAPAKIQGLRNSATLHDLREFDANRISNRLSNDGEIVSWHLHGNAGMEWPRGSGKTIDFASGLWLVGKLGRTLRAAVADYSSEFRPGPILPNGLPADPEDPQYRIYKIRSDGTGDWSSWPFDDGAPAAKTVDGRDSLDAQGCRIPQLLGDQTL